jgi:ABC-type Fe3+-hydroxamate transport system substrate-binding protein
MGNLDSQLVDAIGTIHEGAGSDARIVCLVPSITELLFDLGLGDNVVGRTGFCIHPKQNVKAVPKVGGTKDVNLAKIRELAPTHLIVNVDENEKRTVEELAKFVPNVIVTHPLAPLDNVTLYRLIGGIFGRASDAENLCLEFHAAYDEAIHACANLPRERVLYLIWKLPWMTVSRDTYISRTLAAIGWDTVEIDSPDRYPKFELAPELLWRVDRALLSSEPYAFRQRDVEAVTGMLNILSPVPGHAVPTVAVSLIDAEMASWYGSRAIDGMRYLSALRNNSKS